VDDQGEKLMEVHRPKQPVQTRKTATGLAHRFVLGIQVDDEEAWFATSDGLSRGVFAPRQRPADVAHAQ
jgi:hypothetical protein